MSRAPTYMGRCRTTPMVMAAEPAQKARGRWNRIDPRAGWPPDGGERRALASAVTRPKGRPAGEDQQQKAGPSTTSLSIEQSIFVRKRPCPTFVRSPSVTWSCSAPPCAGPGLMPSQWRKRPHPSWGVSTKGCEVRTGAATASWCGSTGPCPWSSSTTTSAGSRPRRSAGTT